jgi:hypothetical protein
MDNIPQANNPTPTVRSPRTRVLVLSALGAGGTVVGMLALSVHQAFRSDLTEWWPANAVAFAAGLIQLRVCGLANRLLYSSGNNALQALQVQSYRMRVMVWASVSVVLNVLAALPSLLLLILPIFFFSHPRLEVGSFLLTLMTFFVWAGIISSWILAGKLLGAARAAQNSANV